MGRYIARRLLQAVPLLVGVSMITFAILHAIPGGPLGMYTRAAAARPEDIERIRHLLGLDKPLSVQYLIWLGRWLRGDWGISYMTKQPVIEAIKDRLPNTVILLSAAYLLALLVGIPGGIIAATKQYSLLDNALTIFAFIGFCVPVFWLGLIMIIIFDVNLHWLPGGGMYTLGAPFSIVDRIRHLIMPATAGALYNAGMYLRYLRGSLLEVINLDYIRTARAKGLHERTVLLRHAMRNALIPLVTIATMDLPWIIGGAVLTESIFSWPGMGRLFWQAALNMDYPVLLSIVMLVSVAVILGNLLADVLYAFLDPRIVYQ